MLVPQNTKEGQHSEALKGVSKGRNALCAYFLSPSSSVFSVFLFLMVDGGFLAVPRTSTAAVNPPIAVDQLVGETIRNELQAHIRDQTHWRFRELKEEDGRKELREVFETKDGDIDRLLAVDDHPLAPGQSRMEDRRIQKLLVHPDKVRKERQKQDEDNEKEIELLKSFPLAFQYRYESKAGNLMALKFSPNPYFRPSNREEQVLHHLEGTMWIDLRQKRLARIEGHLTSEVKFVGGLLGHLDEGGSFSVRLEDVGLGHWDLDSLDVRLKGKAFLFKTIRLQQKEHCTNYHLVPTDMTLEQAAELLMNDATGQGSAVAAKSARP